MKNVQTFHVLEEVPFHITGLGGTKKVHDWSPSFTEEEAHKPRKKKNEIITRVSKNNHLAQ